MEGGLVMAFHDTRAAKEAIIKALGAAEQANLVCRLSTFCAYVEIVHGCFMSKEFLDEQVPFRPPSQ